MAAFALQAMVKTSVEEAVARLTNPVGAKEKSPTLVEMPTSAGCRVTSNTL